MTQAIPVWTRDLGFYGGRRSPRGGARVQPLMTA
jgi:hypothetical protein